MTTIPSVSTTSNQALLAQYRTQARNAALQRLGIPVPGDSASIGAQGQALSDVASGASASSASSAISGMIARLPADPVKLERIASRLEARVARMPGRTQAGQGADLAAIADAIRQRATALRKATATA